MNKVFGAGRIRVSRVGLVAGVVVATVVGLAVPAGANTGHVFTAQSCTTWSASVTLDNNVKADFFVEVMSTIPGTTGIVDGHYNTTANVGTVQIWSATGAAPSSGTVTLTILNPNRTLDFTVSAALPPAPVCPTSTTTSAPAPPTTSVQTVPLTVVSSTTTSTPSTTPPTSPPTTPPTFTHQGTTVPTTSTTTTVPTIITSPNTVKSPPLPRTGSNTSFPVAFGFGSLALGGLLALRRRRGWVRS